MDDLTILVPAQVIAQREANKVTPTTIRNAVLKTIIGLAETPATRKPKRGETANAYFLRVMRAAGGGVPPSLDETYVKGYTRRQWLALSDEERQALWDKWYRQAEKEIDAHYGESVHVRIENLAGQKRSHKNPSRVREKRAGY